MPTKHEHLERITQRIIEEMERGTVPWVKEWKTLGKYAMPHNAVSLKAYRGINVLSLWIEAEDHGYPTSEWVTYKQAAGEGWQVRKGEKATQIVYFEKLRVQDRDDESKTKQIPMLKIFHVFNVAQIEGVPERVPIVRSEWEVIDAAETFCANTGALVHHRGDAAYYSPTHDHIVLPTREQFDRAAGYYATRLHETTHWTGHESRCNREFSKRFGSDAYAFEELVAEIGAAFLCGHLAIPGELRHAGYLAHWLKILKGDHHAIFTAAARATEAYEYLLAHQTATLSTEVKAA